MTGQKWVVASAVPRRLATAVARPTVAVEGEPSYLRTQRAKWSRVRVDGR